MRGRDGGEVRAALLCCAILFVVAPAYADAIDPNWGPFFAGDSLTFNYNANQKVFDSTVGTKGALVDFDSAADGGGIISSNPNYPSGSFTFGIRWEVPLLLDTTNPFFDIGASGEFGNEGGQPALTWALVDLQNADTVLLSGEIMSSPGHTYDFIVGEIEMVAPGKLFPADGGGTGGLIGLTVTGGTLASQFTSKADMTFESFIVPNPRDFGSDMWTPGAGSVTIFAVPEPGTACLLLGGLVAYLARRKRA